MDVMVSSRDRWMAFLKLCRPQFLVPGLFLYVLGFLLALSSGVNWDLGRFAWGYLVFFLAHFSLTFSNDFFDREADSLNTPTPLSGGSGALGQHPELSLPAIILSVVLIASSITVALYFQLLYGPDWYFLPLVLAGNMLGFFYTAPPLCLSYRGLGEVATMIAVGLIMPGMGFICASGDLGSEMLKLVPAFMVYGAFFILSVEMPDVEADRKGGKRNLLVRYGLRNGFRAALLSVMIGSIVWALLWQFAPSGILDYMVILIFSLVPLIAGIVGMTRDPLDREEVVKQVKLNFTAILSFILLFDAYLLMII